MSFASRCAEIAAVAQDPIIAPARLTMPFPFRTLLVSQDSKNTRLPFISLTLRRFSTVKRPVFPRLMYYSRANYR